MLYFELNQTAGAKVSKAVVRSWVKKISRAVKLKNYLEFSLAIVGDQAIKKLNRQYRGKNTVTDVLSFSEQDIKEKFTPKSSRQYLGEIVIGYPQTVRRAKTMGHSVKQELEILFVHGFMHLLGYDHKTSSQAKAMERLEEKILKG